MLRGNQHPTAVRRHRLSLLGVLPKVFAVASMTACSSAWALKLLECEEDCATDGGLGDVILIVFGLLIAISLWAALLVGPGALLNILLRRELNDARGYDAWLTGIFMVAPTVFFLSIPAIILIGMLNTIFGATPFWQIAIILGVWWVYLRWKIFPPKRTGAPNASAAAEQHTKPTPASTGEAAKSTGNTDPAMRPAVPSSNEIREVLRHAVHGRAVMPGAAPDPASGAREYRCSGCGYYWLAGVLSGLCPKCRWHVVERGLARPAVHTGGENEGVEGGRDDDTAKL